MSDADFLDLPPFPPLTWDDFDWWEGEIDLGWDGSAGLSVTPYDAAVSRQPTEFQREAMAFQLQHGDEVVASILAALLPYYEQLRPRFLDYLGDEADTLMPRISSPTELQRLIDLRHVHIHPWSKDGVGYVGLQFGCTWDAEHGLGLMMHQDRVVSIGGADTSFAWEPEEADEPS